MINYPKIQSFVLGNRGKDGVNNLCLWMSRSFRNLFGKWEGALGLTICGCACPENLGNGGGGGGRWG